MSSHLFALLRKNRFAPACPQDHKTRPVSTWTGFKPIAAKLRPEVIRRPLPQPAGTDKRAPHLYGKEGTPIRKEDRGRIISLAREYNAQTRRPKQQGDLKASGILVLETLVFKFWDHFTGQCTPAIATIAKAAGVSERTAQRALIRLREAGLISWIRRVKIIAGKAVQSSNRYRIGCQSGHGIPGSYINMVQKGVRPLLESVARSIGLLPELLDRYALAKTAV